MKNLKSNARLIVFVAGLALNGSTLADHAGRDFTGTNGCTIKGDLLDYDVENQIATILRKGKTDPCRAHIDRFCEADRQFITNWASERDFQNSLKVSMRLVNAKSNEEIKDRRYDPQYIECRAFELQIENQSDTAFLMAEVEYCVFYKQVERGGATRTRQDGVLCDRVEIGTMIPGFRKDLKTQLVMLYQEEGHTTSLFGSDGGSYGDVEGIWLRVTATLPSGEQVVRNVCHPENLSRCRDWTTTTVSVGLNRKTHRSVIRCPRVAPVELPGGFTLTRN